MKLRFLPLFVLLVGCSVGSLENQKPIFSANSTKNTDALNRCLAPKWLNLNSSTSSIPTETGYKITASDDIFGALAVAKINEAKQGSSVEVFAVARGWNDHWANAVRSCL